MAAEDARNLTRAWKTLVDTQPETIRVVRAALGGTKQELLGILSRLQKGKEQPPH